MTNLEKKIAAFKREAGSKEQYNVEQQKIYTAFTRKNGRPIRVEVIDCSGIKMKISLDSTTEVKKILLKHYKGKEGRVTADEILRMFDVVRYGHKKSNHGNFEYTLTFDRGKFTYFTIVKLFPNGEDAILKSFYTNRVAK